jgi:hypothetical protein
VGGAPHRTAVGGDLDVEVHEAVALVLALAVTTPRTSTSAPSRTTPRWWARVLTWIHGPRRTLLDRT